MKLTEAEWSVMEVLWEHEQAALAEITRALAPVQGWNKKTVFTYLSRMEKKGLVRVDRSLARPYAPAVSREECAREEREDLLSKVYRGRAGDLIAAFLRESELSQSETARLRRLLDEMEV